VLFGPPGTAKTTTAESVAAALGYGFVVIDTAVFLEDGLANIASRMAYVFDRLERLRDCVILFDEIEEFCLDRTTPGLGMESRILTTAMLTRLNDLRRAERSIFLVATCVEIKILRHVRAESSHHPPPRRLLDGTRRTG
jgi:SpoVK/Ycf46/Vps4 family AAA+-type ATPase